MTADTEADVRSASNTLSEAIISRLKGDYSQLPTTVYGPFEAQVYKVNDKYRMRMVVKCRLNRRSRALFHELLMLFAQNRKATLSVDLNPLTV